MLGECFKSLVTSPLVVLVCSDGLAFIIQSWLDRLYISMNVSMFSRIPNCWSIIVYNSLLGYIVFQLNPNQRPSGNFYRNRKTFAKRVR